MELTEENYYSKEADQEYMSVSQFKDFFGSYGRVGCEFNAMKKLHGEWEDKTTPAMLVGSYVDAWFEGTLDRFKAEHPEIFKKDGSLYAQYEVAEKVIQRVQQDEYFMKYMSGEKQRIMVGEIDGVPWKIKMDSYLPGIAIVDLKVMKSIAELKWVRDIGYLDWVRYWGYDIQGAVYQEIVRQNTGETLKFYIAGASKEDEPDIRVIHITDNFLKEALRIVKANLPFVMEAKNGERTPRRCEVCDCCKHFRVLDRPISISDLIANV